MTSDSTFDSAFVDRIRPHLFWLFTLLLASCVWDSSSDVITNAVPTRFDGTLRDALVGLRSRVHDVPRLEGNYSTKRTR